MSPASGEKICVICGENCAGKPRVKDPKGRYYCRACYEEAQQKKANRESADQELDDDRDHVDERDHLQEPDQPFEIPPGHKQTADFGGSLLDDIDADVEPDMPTGPPVSGDGCPQCGATIDPGAVLCVQCGYNFKTGQAVSASVASEADEEDEFDDDVATRWPTVVGIVSIIFGGLFLLGALFNSMIGALALENPIEVIGIVLGLFIAAAIWIWPVWGGYGLMRRQPIGPRILRIWSLVVVVLGLITLLGAIVGVVLLGETIGEAIAEAVGEGGAGIAAGATGIMIVFVLAVMLPILAWPVFLLLWLRRAVIKGEIASWSNNGAESPDEPG